MCIFAHDFKKYDQIHVHFYTYTELNKDRHLL